MGSVGEPLLRRVEEAVDRTIRMSLSLPAHAAGREIGRQIVRSSGSVGANLEEAQATLTHRDFTHRVGIALRERRETLYGLRRIRNKGLPAADRLIELVTEWNELVSILTAILKKLRNRRTWESAE